MDKREKNNIYETGLALFDACHKARQSIEWTSIYVDQYTQWLCSAVIFLKKHKYEGYETTFRNQIPRAPLSFAMNITSVTGLSFPDNNGEFDFFFDLFERQLKFLRSPHIKMLDNNTNLDGQEHTEVLHFDRLNIKVRGKIVTKGTIKFKISQSESDLIYALYYSMRKNNNARLSVDALAMEMKCSTHHVYNRISFINKKIIKEFFQNKGYLPLIMNEPRRGYYLNSKFLT